MDSQEDIVEAIREAITNNDTEELQRCAQCIDDQISRLGYFPDTLFNDLLLLLQLPAFQHLDDAAYLLKPFEYNLNLLSNQQKQNLSETLEKCYSNFQDPTSCFLIVELICDC